MERENLKILILGDGLLGTELRKQTGWNYISRKKDGCDFTDVVSYSKYLVGYDVIVNCFAYTNTRDNTKDKHWKVNFKAVKDLVDICNLNKYKLVHISTDYVYANSKQFASEEDVPAHLPNWYAYTKLLSDGLVQLESKNHLVIRCSFKNKPYPYSSAWPDLYGNFDYVDFISSKIIELIKKEANGVYNVGRKEVISLLQLAKMTNDKVVGSYSSDYNDRPNDITIDLNKLNKFLNETT